MAQYYTPGYESQRFQHYAEGLKTLKETKEKEQKENITTAVNVGKTTWNIFEGGRKEQQAEALRLLNIRSEDTPSGFKYKRTETPRPESWWGRVKHRYRPAEERVGLDPTYEERDLGKTIEDLGYQDPDVRLGKFDPTAYGEGLRKKSEMYRRNIPYASEREDYYSRILPEKTEAATMQRSQELSEYVSGEGGRFRFTPGSQSVGGEEIGQLPPQSFGRTTVGRDLPYGGRKREYTATGPGSYFGDLESEIEFDPQYEFAPGTGSIRQGDPFPEPKISSREGEISQTFKEAIWSKDEFESFGAGIEGAGIEGVGSFAEAGSTVGAGESLISEGADTAGGSTPYASIAKGLYETQDVYRSGASASEMRKQTVESGLDVASSYAIGSGNPYLMAAGVGYKLWDRFEDPWA